ncbi:hypothetical protein Tco_0525620 [Tanacetum coccineum]
MADKYEYEKRKKERLEEVKASSTLAIPEEKALRTGIACSQSRTIIAKKTRDALSSPSRNPSNEYLRAIPIGRQKNASETPSALEQIKLRDERSHKRLHTKSKDGKKGNVKGSSRSSLHPDSYNQESQIPELIKRFHEKIPKMVDEMMQVATSFLQGQKAASNQKRKKAPQAWRHQEGGHRQNFKKGGVPQLT